MPFFSFSTWLTQQQQSTLQEYYTLRILQYRHYLEKNRIQTPYQNKEDACSSILMFPAAVSADFVERRLWMHSRSQKWWECVVHSSVVPAETLEWKGKLLDICAVFFLNKVCSSFVLASERCVAFACVEIERCVDPGQTLAVKIVCNTTFDIHKFDTMCFSGVLAIKSDLCQ